MKSLIRMVAISLVGSSIFTGTAFSQETDITGPSFDTSYFLTIRGATGPALKQNDFSAPTLGQSGHFEDRMLSGLAAEVGYLLNEHMSVSAAFTYGRIDHEDQVFDTGVVLDLDGHTNIFQGFVKTAYEVGFEELGFESDFASRSSVFGVAGIGLTHLKNDAILRNAAFGDGVADGSDTRIQGKIGGGYAYRITENIDFVSEYTYIFGGDADVTLEAAAIGSQPVEIGANAHSLQVGLRFNF